MSTGFFVVLLNWLAFGTLTVFSIVRYRVEVSPRLRRLALTSIGVVSILWFGSTIRILVQGGVIGSVDEPLTTPVLELSLLWTAAAIAIGLVGLIVLPRATKELSRGANLVAVVATRHPNVKVDSIGLTMRELQVLEVLAEGRLSDDEIAASLAVTPATAATHVRNILGKAGMHDRRDLLTLGFEAPGESTPSRE